MDATLGNVGIVRYIDRNPSCLSSSSPSSSTSSANQQKASEQQIPLALVEFRDSEWCQVNYWWIPTNLLQKLPRVARDACLAFGGREMDVLPARIAGIIVFSLHCS
jgi:hypothetical protein